MSKLIEALQIFLKYEDPAFPTHCEHDVLYVQIDPQKVSTEDLLKLYSLGFFPNDDNTGFSSHKYGSC